MNKVQMNNIEEDRLFFEFLLLKGLKKIGREKDEKYIKRLKHEFDRMVKKKYINYFLCNWDFIDAAKKKGIAVGPCRGSAGASLVAYCLGITDIDPIEHNLLFTRFLSPIRRDAPDIDLDFQDNRRQKIYDYLMEKYGETHCAKVATYSRFHPKGLLLDIGRIFDIPRAEVSRVSSLVIERCLAKDSLICVKRKSDNKDVKISIKDLLGKEELYEIKIAEIKNKTNAEVKRGAYEKKIGKVLSEDAFKVKKTSKKKKFKIILEDGGMIECSSEHRFWTRNGWKKLKDLSEDDEILCITQDTQNNKGKRNTCRVCGKDSLHKVCSPRCLKISGFEEYEVIVCKNCNKKSVAIKRAKRKFCSLSCITAHKNKTNNPMKNKETVAKMIKTKKGCKVWNKGLNAMDDLRVRENIRRGRKTCARKGYNKCEVKLYDCVKKIFKDYEIEREFSESGYLLDVAVKKLKFDFEFDGIYWHGLPGAKEHDLKRKKFLEAKGWKVFSINEHDFKDELMEQKIRRIFETK